ncbi:MAG TPA: hypothetical protein VGP94_00275, partial [Tepidisphaeraceae bacterium]|nr:hypothetical protein [Tepidisphaeraceae bacterium]
ELETRQLMSVVNDTPDLTMSGLQTGQRSGVSVTTWGNNVVIGAYLTDIGTALDAGAVYIRDASTGALLRTIQKAVPISSDLFGQAVAASADGCVLVGSPLDNLGFSDAGAAFLYNGNDGTLFQTFKNPTPALGDQFGSAVSFVGSQFVLIGAKGDDSLGLNAGAAYLFNRSTAALVATYFNPSPSANDYFGNAVAALGDDVVIGSYYDDRDGLLRNGAVYIYSGSVIGPTMSPRLVLANPTPATDDHFGISLATYGNNILIGCDGEDKGAIDAGAAYLFDGASGTLLQSFFNPAPAISDKFGNSVALNATSALIGAQADDYGVLNGGSAYLFDIATGALTYEFHNRFARSGDNFGSDVDFMDDGSVLIGAAGDDSAVLDSGAVHRFKFA